MITTELTTHGGKAIACGVGISWSNSPGLVMDGEHRCAEPLIGQQPVAQLTQIPWGHNVAIITKCQSQEEAIYYAHNTLNHGWNRAVLTHQIESRLWQGWVMMAEASFRIAGIGSQGLPLNIVVRGCHVE